MPPETRLISPVTSESETTLFFLQQRGFRMSSYTKHLEARRTVTREASVRDTVHNTKPDSSVQIKLSITESSKRYKGTEVVLDGKLSILGWTMPPVGLTLLCSALCKNLTNHTRNYKERRREKRFSFSSLDRWYGGAPGRRALQCRKIPLIQHISSVGNMVILTSKSPAYIAGLPAVIQFRAVRLCNPGEVALLNVAALVVFPHDCRHTLMDITLKGSRGWWHLLQAFLPGVSDGHTWKFY